MSRYFILCISISIAFFIFLLILAYGIISQVREYEEVMTNLTYQQELNNNLNKEKNETMNKIAFLERENKRLHLEIECVGSCYIAGEETCICVTTTSTTSTTTSTTTTTYVFSPRYRGLLYDGEDVESRNLRCFENHTICKNDGCMTRLIETYC